MKDYFYKAIFFSLLFVWVLYLMSPLVLRPAGDARSHMDHLKAMSNEKLSAFSKWTLVHNIAGGLKSDYLPISLTAREETYLLNALQKRSDCLSDTNLNVFTKDLSFESFSNFVIYTNSEIKRSLSFNGEKERVMSHESSGLRPSCSVSIYSNGVGVVLALNSLKRKLSGMTNVTNFESRIIAHERLGLWPDDSVAMYFDDLGVIRMKTDDFEDVVGGKETIVRYKKRLHYWTR